MQAVSPLSRCTPRCLFMTLPAASTGDTPALLCAVGSAPSQCQNTAVQRFLRLPFIPRRAVGVGSVQQSTSSVDGLHCEGLRADVLAGGGLYLIRGDEGIQSRVLGTNPAKIVDGKILPRLRTLTMTFDATALLTPSPPVSHRHLITMDVQLSPISTPSPVARFLSEIFPNLWTVATDVDHDPGIPETSKRQLPSTRSVGWWRRWFRQRAKKGWCACMILYHKSFTGARSRQIIFCSVPMHSFLAL
ncbi:hypothetical protein DFH09DRAFT_1399657 [Mycena vulgaris]|nr:hypothetical protein DFH09DRAFT_1399657 [Mycena vulgaris]